MSKAKICILSTETIERCRNEIATRNPNLQPDDWVYIDGTPIAIALGGGRFRYLGPLAERDNNSSESNLKILLFDLGIIDSKSASIDHLTVPDEQPSVAASNPPAKHIEISGVQKNSAGFCFLPKDAEAIKDAIQQKKRKTPGEKINQRYLLGKPDTARFVGRSLNNGPIHLLDFVQILRALVERGIVTLGDKTLEDVLQLPDVHENSPLELFKEDIHFKGSKICLSEEAISKINALLFKKNLKKHLRSV